MIAHRLRAAGTRKSAKGPGRRADAGSIAGGGRAPSPAPLAGSPAAKPDSGISTTHAFIEPEPRRAMIAEAANYLAERRGFEPDRELADGVPAEGEIDGKLTRGELPDAGGAGGTD